MKTLYLHRVDLGPNDPKPDVYLGYSGGSGGFLLLHLLLCSGEYHVSFIGGYSFDDVIDLQWQVTDSNLWKTNEIWPDRLKTIMDTNPLPRIFFRCNPLPNTWGISPEHIKLGYQQCKDPAWPDIEDFESYSKLPKHIRDECEIQHGLAPMVHRYAARKKFVWLYTDLDSQVELAFYKKARWYAEAPEKPLQIYHPEGIYNNMTVALDAVPFLQQCDTALYLQDVVRNPSILVDQGLIESVNDRQIQLIKKWLSLHPPELLRKIKLLD